MEARSVRKKFLLWCITLSLPLLCAGGLWLVWRSRQLHTTGGKKLNRLVWEASFEERGLRVPPDGPRDGYWGGKMPSWVDDPDVGWHEGEVHRPGLVEVDSSGMQSLRVGNARAHVLIIGGSVAWGAYASSEAETYFAGVSRYLVEAGVPADLTVLAAGAWTSENELKAVRLYGASLRPDVVVFLDGLNDLGLSTDDAPNDGANEKALRYLDNLREARNIAHAQGAQVILSLQPALTQKRRKTDYEERILELTADNVEIMLAAYPQMRAGLRNLGSRAGTRFVDCSDALSLEYFTTFADIWHFSDPGQRALGRCLGEGLVPMLREIQQARQP